MINRGSVALALTVGWVVTACQPTGGDSATDFSSDSPPEVAADSLIGLWIKALGGMDTYSEFQAASYTITTIIFDTLSGRVKRARPRYVWIKKTPRGQATRVERWEGNDLIIQEFNGQDHWATVNDVALSEGEKDWDEVRYVAGDLFYWPGLPYKLRDDGVFLHYRGPASRPGVEMRTDPTAAETETPNTYHTVGVTFGEDVGDHQDVWQYFFKPGEIFPTEVTYIEAGRENINRVIWGDTEMTGASNYPVVERRDWIAESGKRTKALVVSDFVANPEIDQSMFERPTTSRHSEK